MSLIITTTVKGRGKITWPPIGEPGQYSSDGSVEKEATGRIEWLREQIRQAAADTRAVLGTLETTRVHVQVSFRPDVMVDPA